MVSSIARSQAAAVLAAVTSLACSADPSNGSDLGYGYGSGATAGASSGGTGGAPNGGAGGSGAVSTDAPFGPSPSGELGEVYGHSKTTLYKLEPYSKVVSVVGNFDCLPPALGNSGMWDIAIDKGGKMVGSTNDGLGRGTLVTIDPATARCQIVGQGVYPNSLAFVPAGTVLPADEALVGYNDASYVRIDLATGAVVELGSLNPNPTGERWESSGDIVSIIGGGTYLTVRPKGTTSGQVDSIVEIDPKTGQATRLIGNTGFSDLWGLGYWAGVAYAFSAGGQLVEIDLMTGAGLPIPLGAIPAGLSFWGAGTTTAAPIAPPR
jgi:hypothetical protein